MPASLVAALERDLGETGADYLAKAAAATDAVAVVKQLRATGVHILGSHLSGTQLVVNVATASDEAAVTAAGADPVVGKPTPPAAPARPFRAAVATNILDGSGYWFEDSDFIYQCSVGFNGADVASGAPQLVTAGHCFAGAGPLVGSVRTIDSTTPVDLSAPPTTGAVIGLPDGTATAFGGGTDQALVNETGSSITESDQVTTWGASGTLPVFGQTAAEEGATLCKSGSRTGWTCGTVLAVDQVVGIQDDNGIDHAVNSVIATTCVLPGDSGGAAMIGHFAAGITSGSTYASSCSESGQIAAFYTMVSGDGGASVASSLARWELGVQLSTPVVTSIANGGSVAAGPFGSISGTLANSSTSDQVCLYVDSTSSTPNCWPVAADGTWRAGLGGSSVGSHTYYVRATYGQHSVSAFASGSYVVPDPATITGTMTDRAGGNLDGYVDLYSTGGTGPNTTTFAGDYVVTNGEFTAYGLLPGSYALAFVVSNSPVNADYSPGSSGDYVTQWYSGDYTYASATAVVLPSAGSTASGIDVVMEDPTFSDASDPTSSVYPYIQWMASSGISTGTPNPPGKPLYKPSVAVSRQAMASFLFKLSGDTFTAPDTPTFADVDSSNPFDTAIEWMAAQGISTGTAQPSGKPLFKPTDPVSRQAMALFLARYDHVDLSTPPTTQSFADVPLDASSAAAIGWMASTGISTGTAQPSGLPLYKPANPVSRSAMAAFLYRLAHLPT